MLRIFYLAQWDLFVGSRNSTNCSHYTKTFMNDTQHFLIHSIEMFIKRSNYGQLAPPKRQFYRFTKFFRWSRNLYLTFRAFTSVAKSLRAEQDKTLFYFVLHHFPFTFGSRDPTVCAPALTHTWPNGPFLGITNSHDFTFHPTKKKIENKNSMQDNSRWANPFPNKTHLQSFSLPSPFPLFCCLLSAFPKCGFRSITRPSRGRKGKRKQVFDR